jgi:hypothetical protein
MTNNSPISNGKAQMTNQCEKADDQIQWNLAAVGLFEGERNEPAEKI